MKATRIIVLITLLGIMISFNSNQETFDFRISPEDWCYSTKGNMNTFTFCDERITDKSEVYIDKNQLPFKDHEKYYALSVQKGKIHIGIKMIDGSKPEHIQDILFNVITR